MYSVCYGPVNRLLRTAYSVRSDNGNECRRRNDGPDQRTGEDPRRRHAASLLQPAAVVRLRRCNRRQHHGSHGRDDRQRRRTVDPGRARRQRLHPAVAARRLHARVRRVPHHRRPARGHVRPPPAVPGRLGRLHRDVRCLLGRPLDGGADHLPGAAGLVRGADDPSGVRDAQRGLRRGRDDQGVRRVRPDDGSLDPRCADPRGRAGGGRSVGDRVAAGVPDQRAGRHRRVRRGGPGATANRRASRDALGHRWDAADRRRADRDHLPADPGPHGRMARLDLRVARRRSGAARSVRAVRAPPSAAIR